MLCSRPDNSSHPQWSDRAHQRTAQPALSQVEGTRTATPPALGALTYAYDFENHLVQQGLPAVAGGAKFVYDGDGNRVEKIVAGVTTKYLVATVNPTGYPQVVYETFSGTGITEFWRQFVYGLDRISQYRQITSATQKSYYVYDGHGSVRALADQNGNVTDTYDYDAFGNIDVTKLPNGAGALH